VRGDRRPSMSASNADSSSGRVTVTEFGSGLREVTLDAGTAQDHRAYWREIARCGTEIGMPPFRFEMAAHGPDFHSRLRWGAGAGVHFLDGETNRPVSQRAMADVQADAIVVGGLRRGRLRIAHGRDATLLIEPGTLFLSDYGRRMHLDWTPHNFLFLVLPRKLVAPALGRHADFRGETVCPLPSRGLVPLLWAQLTMLAAHGHTLEADEWSVALSATADVTLGALRHHFGMDGKGPARSHDALLDAARRYIAQQCERPDLTAEEVAASVGCSRTRLYRIFAEAGLVVGDYLREIRLNRARAALETGTDGESLGTLAFQCGYSDLSAFGKAFRRRFGVPPSEWRARHPASGAPP
jgi:AraC family transcriptional regulator, positive regulator of tynA and feaB